MDRSDVGRRVERGRHHTEEIPGRIEVEVAGAKLHAFVGNGPTLVGLAVLW